MTEPGLRADARERLWHDSCVAADVKVSNMAIRCGGIALCAVSGAMLACTAEVGGPTPDALGASISMASVPACAIDPYYCHNEPFALGGWVGDTGPFAALVLSDQLCGDYGYCFVGHLADGTRIEGSYFDRPQLTHFSWSGGGLGFEGYSVTGEVLTLHAGPEQNVIPVATLHRVTSYCDFPSDCQLQSLSSMPCYRPTTRCLRHYCQRSCERSARQ